MPSTCALNYDVLPCDYVMKVVGRDPVQFLFAIISARIGSPMHTQHTTSQYDGGSILLGSSSSQDPKTGNYTASVTVEATPEVLVSIESLNASLQWIDLRPIQQIVQQNHFPTLKKDDHKED